MATPAMSSEEREIDKKDRAWDGPKFFGLGMVTLLIAITVIIYAAMQSGCGLKIVP